MVAVVRASRVRLGRSPVRARLSVRGGARRRNARRRQLTAPLRHAPTAPLSLPPLPTVFRSIVYCVLIPLTYISFLFSGYACLGRMRKMGLIGAGNSTLPLLANAQPVGGYQPPMGGPGGGAGGPVLVAVATATPQNVGAPVAVPVAQAVAFAPAAGSAAAVPVAKAYVATDVEAAMSG